VLQKGVRGGSENDCCVQQAIVPSPGGVRYNRVNEKLEISVHFYCSLILIVTFLL